MPAGVPEPRNQNILSAEHTQSALQIVLLSAAFPGQVGAAGHLMDGAVRLLNGRALQLAAQAGLDVGQILLPQCLLFSLFGLGQTGGLAFFGQRIDAGDLFFRLKGTSCISS